MKNLLLTTFILLSVFSTAVAQMPDMQGGSSQSMGGTTGLFSGLKLTAGITGGDFAFTDATGNSTDADIGPSLGYFLGLSKDYQLTENIVFQPGAGLVGFSVQANGGDYTWNIHYLSFHGNMQYRTAFKIYGAAGLYLDYGLFGSQGYPSGDSVDAFDSGGLTRLNTGINFELGYPINIGEKQADVFGAYRIGVNNMEADDAEVGQTTKGRMFTIGLRYSL